MLSIAQFPLPPISAAGASHAGWALLTRLGEAQILLPAMLLSALWIGWQPEGRRAAITWVLATAAAAVLTTASKVAFIGYEVGYAPLNYAGISGHAMFACAILPVLLAVAAGQRGPAYLAAGAGVVLSLLVAYSRVKIRAHSPIEIAVGGLFGLWAAGVTLRTVWRHGPGNLSIPLWLPAGVLAWLLVTPTVAPRSRTHDWVTSLSLTVSGRPMPYTRQQMLRTWQLQRAVEAAAANAGR